MQAVVMSHQQARFGEDVLEKMSDWVIKHAPVTSNPFILDVGTGNGNVLFGLVDAGYNPERLCGIDYSEDAVRLARNVAVARRVDAIAFKSLDFLNERPAALEGMADDRWDLVIDKGTLDAIALAAPSDDNSIPSDKYPAQVAAILKPGGFFLITCECYSFLASSRVLSLPKLAISQSLNFVRSLRVSITG
jgi:SAM-dependent methyltransferase